MIKTISAHTREIDEIGDAVQEILEQLNLQENLMKNSVGFLSCYAEFVDSGVTAAVCEQLPFDVIGISTIGNMCDGQIGDMMLVVTVLTSDDVSFSAVCTEPLSQEYCRPINDAYKNAAKRLPEAPSFILAAAPLLTNLGGDTIIKQLDSISGGIPIFGTVTVDHNEDYRQAVTIFNGRAYKENLCFILMSGNVKPKFLVASLAEEKIRKQKTIITSSENNVLKEVNGISIIKYMESLGVISGGKRDGAIIPFVVDYNDGSKPVARVIFLLTEDSAVCGGEMPMDATLSIGSIDYEDVIATSKLAMDSILSEGDKQGLFMFSCIARFMVLGANTSAEMEIISEKLESSKYSYQLAYSGGEICPVLDEKGVLKNRFHNYTFAACIF